MAGNAQSAQESIEAIYPLSPMQQAFLFHHLYTGKSGQGCIIGRCALQGGLNVPDFMRAWQRVVDRHQALRTSLHWEDLAEPLQVVHRDSKLPWVQQDWRGESPPEQEARLESFVEAEREQGFDLTQAPLMRLALIQVAKDSYYFVWSVHHVMVDGWSNSLLLKEAFAYYEAFRRGQELDLPRPRPYADYVAWLGRQDLAQAEAFWRQTLQGFASPTPLGVALPSHSPSSQEAVHGAEHITLGVARTAAVHAFAQQHRLTLNTLVRGAWALLLSHYSGKEDVAFGTSVSSRSATLPGVESMVGLCINMLPVRVQVSPQTPLLSWLKQLQHQQVELSQYEWIPPAKIQEWSEVPGNLPLYESLLEFENYKANTPLGGQDGSLKLRVLQANIVSNYPLTLIVEPGPELVLRLMYLQSRFDRPSVNRMLDHLQSLLENMVADSQQLLADLPTISRDPRRRRSLEAPRQQRREIKTARVASSNSLELQLVKIWERVLGIHPIGVTDNFFELGGRSLQAVPLFVQIEKTFGKKLPLATLFQAPTIQQLAGVLVQKGWSAPWSSLVAIQPKGSKPPFFCVHAVGGHSLTYAELAYHLGEDQPFYGLEAPGRDGEQAPLTSLEELAALYIKEIRTLQPEGPYHLGGLSLGGLVAFEMAQQLHAQDQQVALLALLDTPCPVRLNTLDLGLQHLERITYFGRRLAGNCWQLCRLRPREGLRYLQEKYRSARTVLAPDTIHRVNAQAARKYLPKPYPGLVTLFWATGERVWFTPDLRLGWSKLAAGGVEYHRVPGAHLTILREPRVRMLAEQLKGCLGAAPPGGVGDRQRLIAH